MTAIIDIEQKYKRCYKSVHFVPNLVGESVPDKIDEDIRFLNDGYIAKHYNPNGKATSALKKQGFDDFEILMLKCFLGGVSYVFKWDSYEDRNSPIIRMCDSLYCALDKTPIYDEGKVLHRFSSIDDEVDFQEGELYHVPHYIAYIAYLRRQLFLVEYSL